MSRVQLSGQVGPERSFWLDEWLTPVTEQVRPLATVDLRTVTDLHPSIISVLIRHQRRAERLGGRLTVIAPSDAMARRPLDHIGLCRTIVGSPRSAALAPGSRPLGDATRYATDAA